MSYQTKMISLGDATIEYRFILSSVEPTPATGYSVIQIADLGDAGKLWMEYKVIK